MNDLEGVNVPARWIPGRVVNKDQGEMATVPRRPFPPASLRNHFGNQIVPSHYAATLPIDLVRSIQMELELWGGPECTINRVDDDFHDQFARTGHLNRPT